MLREYAILYYRKGYNCAESIVRASNEMYALGLHDKDMKMVAGFGGGSMTGDVCGALSASICVLSSKYVETKAHDCDCLRPLIQGMIKAFQNRMTSRLCAQIKPVLYTQTNGCENTVALAADILEDVINQKEQK